MKESTLLEVLRQASGKEIGQIFKGWLRDITRDVVVSVMLREVEELCGAFYHPSSGATYRRGGSAVGRIVLNGKKEMVSRPRVRCVRDGKERERGLLSYAAASDGDDISRRILSALAAGVSSRDTGGVVQSGLFDSKSSVSRLWVSEGLRRVEALRGRELSGETFFCLMLDGIELSTDLTSIVALGITTDGRKMMLDFEMGSSESKEVCDALLCRLIRRGFKTVDGVRVLCVTDGSNSLRNSLIGKFSNPLIQRCLVHKERNIKACLSRRHWTELSRLLKNLRGAQGAEAGREKLSEIRDFLANKNRKALETLDEAGDDLIALHAIGAPSTLNTSLLSTNCIENAFKNVRRKIGRVNRWRTETNQAERWMAYSLTEAEKGFRRIRGYGDIPRLIEAIRKTEHLRQDSL